MPKSVLRMLGGLMLSVLLAFGAAAQQDEIQQTITSQFDAFEANDFERAFGFATPQLQQLFQTPRNFERMVTQGYPMVLRPAEVRFRALRQEADMLIQMVQLTDATGFSHLLDYRMEKTSAGWRIAGVQILEAPGVAA